MTDRELIDGFLSGGTKERRTIQRWIWQEVRGNKKVNRDEWDDVSSISLKKVHYNLLFQKFRGDSSLRKYVKNTAFNTCIDYWRSRHRKRKPSIVPTSSLEWEDEDGIKDPEEYRQEFGTKDDPLTEMLQKEKLTILFMIIGEMKKMCQILLKYGYYQKMKQSEIAQKLGISEGTVKSRTSRCLEKARDLAKRKY